MRRHVLYSGLQPFFSYFVARKNGYISCASMYYFITHATPRWVKIGRFYLKTSMYRQPSLTQLLLSCVDNMSHLHWSHTLASGAGPKVSNKRVCGKPLGIFKKQSWKDTANFIKKTRNQANSYSYDDLHLCVLFPHGSCEVLCFATPSLPPVVLLLLFLLIIDNIFGPLLLNI